MQKKRFIRRNTDPSLTEAQAGLPGFEPLTSHLLAERGITDPAACEKYLRPDFNDLYDPFLLPDMESAVNRIRSALKNEEKICIYGDYDADGTCATAILLKMLRELGGNADYFIPSRHTDGYGMHPETLDRVIRDGAQLIISVDTGITAAGEVAYCASRGVDVIVTDHHIQGDTLPDCCAVVAASRNDSVYPDPDLCGAGVAYKLACALSGKTLRGEYIALAAVATLADIVPLKDENRRIVQLGIPEISECAGLSFLLMQAGLGSDIDYSCVSYVVAPRLNAAGRMGDASRVVRLLVEDDPEVLCALASELEDENRNRKKAEDAILDVISEEFEAECAERAIVLYHPDWNVGVLGIVASKLVERYGKPALVLTEMNGAYTGSGRSVPDVPLYESILPFSERFVRFGGHEKAVGLTIPPERYEQFRSDYIASLTEHYPDTGIRTVRYDRELSLSDVSLKLIREIQLLAPFGEGNPAPVFKIPHARIVSVRQIGKTGAHLDITLTDGGNALRTVAFQCGEDMRDFRLATYGDFLVRLQINSFRGIDSAEAVMVAANLYESGEAESVSPVLRTIKQEMLYNRTDSYAIIKDSFFELCSRSERPVLCCNAVFLRAVYASVAGKIRREGRYPLSQVSDPSVLFGICVFSELGFLEPDASTESVRLNPDAGKRTLAESAIYAAVSDYQIQTYGG